MFVIKYQDKCYLWLNRLSDDFIRFLPDENHFNCNPKDLTIVYINKEDQSNFKNIPGDSKIELNGSVLTVSKDSEVLSSSGCKSVKWPYDGDKFLGNLLE